MSTCGTNMTTLSTPRKLVQCRICHDEDEDSNMEVPCACCGSLKHAHRKCVQRWCIEKGDTTCEICLQQFRPDYTAPPPPSTYIGVSVNVRENWEMSGSNLQDPQFIRMVSPENDLSDTELEYPAASPSGLMCCRIVAIIFTILLVLRYTLPVVITGAGDYSLTLFTLIVLRTIGIILPIFIMVRALSAIKRLRQEVPHGSTETIDEENELPQEQHLSRFIHVQ